MNKLAFLAAGVAMMMASCGTPQLSNIVGDDWKTNLKNLYNNETEKYLDDLFNAWGNY